MTTAYVASNSLPMSALPTASGILQRFPADATNPADATYAPDGLGAAPIFGLGAQPLQGNEIVEGGNIMLVSYIGSLMNSGELCWVLLDCVGGAQQVAPATQSDHAVQFGQLTGLAGSLRNLESTSLVAGAGTSIAFTAEQIVVASALNGLEYLLANFNQTLNGTITGIGGIDTGTIAANTSYAIYAAYNPTTQTQDIFAQLEPTGGAPTIYGGEHLPAGYTATALISVWLTNASAQFIQGWQRDRHVGVASLESNTFTTAITNTSITLNVPFSAWRAELAVSQTTATTATQYQASLGSSSPVAGGVTQCNATLLGTGLLKYVQNGFVDILTPRTCFGNWVVVGGSSPTLEISISGYWF